MSFTSTPRGARSQLKASVHSQLLQDGAGGERIVRLCGSYTTTSGPQLHALLLGLHAPCQTRPDSRGPPPGAGAPWWHLTTLGAAVAAIWLPPLTTSLFLTTYLSLAPDILVIVG
uniref:Uncharacterized protein n=1 Tax=Knipowitschia caucasica TaxID=637954 RepID=A0AAV2LRE8_KNICA